MKIITQKVISLSDLQRNPATFYVFGDNLEAKGAGGQVKDIRGEPNAIGWITKKKATHKVGSYLTNKDLEVFIQHQALTIRTIETLLERGRVVVFPEDRLGSGLAKLEESSPHCWKHLNTGVDYLFKKWSK